MWWTPATRTGPPLTFLRTVPHLPTRRTRAALLATATVVLVASPASTTTSSPGPATATSPHATTTVHGGSASDRALLEEAVARFHSAGLALPDLDVTFHDDEDACRGHDGWFTTATSPWSVRICSDLRFVATHELAHAWIDAHVDPPTEQALLRATGLEHWRGSEVPWEERGVERTAFVIQQVLMSPGGPLTDTWAERLSLFELATGGPVPDRDRWSPGR